MIKAFVILPAHSVFDPARLDRAIEATLVSVANNIILDFQATQQTWKHKAAFKVDKAPHERKIWTSDKIYGYVSGGTKAHDIRPKKAKQLAFAANYTPKTSPGVIGSQAGGPSGPTVRSRGVRHPGTKARDFDKTIAKKWAHKFGSEMQKAVNLEWARP